jgi:hypothetical protein
MNANKYDDLADLINDETFETFARLAATSALAALGKKFPRHQDDIKKHLRME